ncbi:50S ribosomal protein L25 [Impatiens glandulifera]|uniref:50S ribosomal protein L25 n=1 Tax=Impatiens glandulifera TaxID=253017 RepID=UPI001FB11437|nr:50S ribosomal protein L25 [Impatiens glandulifera]
MSKWWRLASGGLKTTSTELRQRSFHTIQAIPRDFTGNRVSARDRAQGRIPAVVFAQSNATGGTQTDRSVSRKQLLTTEKKQIQSILESVNPSFFYSTIFPLHIRAGSGSSMLLESGNVLPVKLHRDEETGRILNLVLVWADKGTELKVDLPIVYKGEDVCPGLKKGGVLQKIRTSIRYMCPSEHIPQKIEIDLSNLDIGDRVLMNDLKVHPELKLLSKNETMPVCKIVTTDMEFPEPAEEAAESEP